MCETAGKVCKHKQQTCLGIRAHADIGQALNGFRTLKAEAFLDTFEASCRTSA